MTIEEIKRRVAAIENAQGDPNIAHDLEDSLLKDFVRYVARSGSPIFSEMAKEILKANELDFPRWTS